MSDKSKHTPTPWKIEIVARRPDLKKVFSIATEHFWIADCGDARLTAVKANAEFIVKACNSYEALLEAAKSAKFFVDDHSSDNEQAMILYSKLEDAIAQAEGK